MFHRGVKRAGGTGGTVRALGDDWQSARIGGTDRDRLSDSAALHEQVFPRLTARGIATALAPRPVLEDADVGNTMHLVRGAAY